MLAPGQVAPDFILPGVDDGVGDTYDLVGFVERHRAVLVLFYPADFVATCMADLLAVQRAGWPDRTDLAVVGISGDSIYAHAAYAEAYGLAFPLLSDFHGGAAESYGLLADDWEGHDAIPMRAAVVVDDEWTIRAVETADPLAEASPAPVEAVADGLEDVLDVSVARPQVEYGDR
jgi:peroxiredoxin